MPTGSMPTVVYVTSPGGVFLDVLALVGASCPLDCCDSARHRPRAGASICRVESRGVALSSVGPPPHCCAGRSRTVPSQAGMGGVRWNRRGPALVRRCAQLRSAGSPGRDPERSRGAGQGRSALQSPCRASRCSEFWTANRTPPGRLLRGRLRREINATRLDGRDPGRAVLIAAATVR